MVGMLSIPQSRWRDKYGKVKLINGGTLWSMNVTNPVAHAMRHR